MKKPEGGQRGTVQVYFCVHRFKCSQRHLDHYLDHHHHDESHENHDPRSSLLTQAEKSQSPSRSRSA